MRYVCLYQYDNETMKIDIWKYKQTFERTFWMPWGLWEWTVFALLFLLSLFLFILLFCLPDVFRYLMIPMLMSLPFLLLPKGPRFHSGDVEVFLEWKTADDLDLHCMGPDGTVINFDNKISPSGGRLDVDMNVGGGKDGRKSVEHIYWPKGQAPQGTYKVLVHLYHRYSSQPKSNYKVIVKYGKNRMTYVGEIEDEKNYNEICEFRME